MRLNLGPLLLATGRYGFDVRSSVVNTEWDHCIESAVEFDVHFSNPLGLAWDFKQSRGTSSNHLDTALSYCSLIQHQSSSRHESS